LEGVRVRGMVILKWILKISKCKLWIECIWFRIEICGGLLWTLWWTFRFLIFLTDLMVVRF
jgi:hypothetical protein